MLDDKMLCKQWLEMKPYEIIWWNHEIINGTSEKMILVNATKGGGEFDIYSIFA